jgi:hypothetical protein
MILQELRRNLADDTWVVRGLHLGSVLPGARCRLVETWQELKNGHAQPVPVQSITALPAPRLKARTYSAALPRRQPILLTNLNNHNNHKPNNRKERI